MISSLSARRISASSTRRVRAAAAVAAATSPTNVAEAGSRRGRIPQHRRHSVRFGGSSCRRFYTTSTKAMGLTLGIVRETYNKYERRAPLCPRHVALLLDKYGPSSSSSSSSSRPLLDGIVVQPASHRIYSDREYVQAGATLKDDLTDADLILGVKQVKEESILPNKSYMFFAHVIKGQPENASLLRTVLERNVRLFDYECINREWIDANNNSAKRRLVAFGRYAGIAGMIDTFQCLGRRLLAEGYGTPFLNCPPTYMHEDLTEAKAGVERMSRCLSRNGLPSGLGPLVFAITGTGNVASGSMEIFSLLPHEMIDKKDLPRLRREWSEQMRDGTLPVQNKVYGVQLASQDLVVRRRRGEDRAGAVASSSERFDRKHYFDHPELYESTFFEQVAPYVNVIVNGIYWDERFPRLLTKNQIRELYESGNRRLFTVADISCDIEGSIEFLEKSTTVEQPFFEYNPITGESSDDITGEGIAIMGVDILPTELPKESSEHFGDALVPLLERLIEAGEYDNTAAMSDAEDETLPVELADACIAKRGRLTPAFEYIQDLIKNSTHAAGHNDPNRPHALIKLRGHLFDSGLINQVLDVMEHSPNCYFEFVECNVRRKVEGVPEKSDVLLKVSADTKEVLEDIKVKVRNLSNLIVAAEASMECFDGTTAAFLGNDAMKEKKKGRGGVTVESEKVQNVLILGAGRVAASLSEYLGRSHRRRIVVASQYEDDAKAVAGEASKDRGVGIALDVTSDGDGLSRLVGDADVVVSLLPAPMHPIVAEKCLEHRTDLVTASYASQEICDMHERCERTGISILNEMGLDPGMDHMSAMKIIDNIKSRGGEVTAFSSVCGGLPAPEAADNPLMYKFSWSPMGVLRASQNDAVYLSEGDVVRIGGADLLLSARPFAASWPSLHLEVLPNRNSLVYADKYGIQSARSLFRGTLRYHGFSSVLQVFKNMGLLDEVDAGIGSGSWGDALQRLQEGRGHSDLRSYILASSGGDVALAAKAAGCLKWLGVTADTAIPEPDSIVRSFCNVLERRLRFEEGERDMVLMNHTIHASFGDGNREMHRSSLQLFGDGKMSAMCKTVGYTAAVGADLLLSAGGGFKTKGVLLPTSKSIYEPCLAALEKEGIRFEEDVEFDAGDHLLFGA